VATRVSADVTSSRRNAEHEASARQRGRRFVTPSTSDTHSTSPLWTTISSPVCATNLTEVVL